MRLRASFLALLAASFASHAPAPAATARLTNGLAIPVSDAAALESPRAADAPRAAWPARIADAAVPFVIVTDAALAPAFAVLASAHTAAGLVTSVHTLQAIQADHPAGVDDAERIRMFLQTAHAAWGTRFVLIGGDEPLLPIRRACLRGIGASDLLLPTDQYYACLDGTWNADGDGLWGESPQPGLGEPGDDVDFLPELHVGRAPVTNLAEAQGFVQKSLDAMVATQAGARLEQVLLAAGSIRVGMDVIDLAPAAQALIPDLTLDPATHVARLYDLWASWPGSLPESPASVRDSLDRGYDVAALHGKGGPGVFIAGEDEVADVLAASDLLALGNLRRTHAFFMSAYTNQPGTLSIGAALMRAPAGGAVTVLGPTDIEFVSIANNFIDGVLQQAYAGGAPTIGEALSGAIASFGSPVSDFARLTTQGNLLLGDPALSLPGTVPGGPTGVAVSLVSADAVPGLARLVWRIESDEVYAAQVQRRTEASEWIALATLPADGDGRLAFEDRSVVAGTRYGYRLAVSTGSGEQLLGEAWLTVPASPGLALAGARPNPAPAGLRVAFTLPDGAPARLDAFDPAGRRVAGREVGALGAGEHLVDLAAGRGLAPGLYLVRLTRGDRSLVARAYVVR